MPVRSPSLHLMARFLDAGRTTLSQGHLRRVLQRCWRRRAGIARLADLDRKRVVAGTTSVDSAPIGDSRALYRGGILSHVNGAATRLGGRVGMPLKEFVDIL